MGKCDFDLDRISVSTIAYSNSILVTALQELTHQFNSLFESVTKFTTRVASVSKSCTMLNIKWKPSKLVSNWKLLFAPCGRILHSGLQGEFGWAIIAPQRLTINLTVNDLRLDCSWTCGAQSLTVFENSPGPTGRYPVLHGPSCCRPPPQAVYSHTNGIFVVLRLQPSIQQAHFQILYQFQEALIKTLRPLVTIRSSSDIS